MTNDGNNTLVYDAENRLLSATNGGSSGTYTYDGNSLRVKKVSGSTTTIYIFSGTKVIAEYSGTSAPYSLAREYIYSGGALLAKIESGTTKYYHSDHLSNRLVTDSGGNTIAQLGHYPFGESWYNATSDKLLFTSYERDSESGNDYAMMRSSVNRLARFSSPDHMAGSTSDPQSLNHYTYALNDPANLADPSGLRPAYAPAMSGATFSSWQFDVFLNGAETAFNTPTEITVGPPDDQSTEEQDGPLNQSEDVLNLLGPNFPIDPGPLVGPIKQPPPPPLPLECTPAFIAKANAAWAATGHGMIPNAEAGFEILGTSQHPSYSDIHVEPPRGALSLTVTPNTIDTFHTHPNNRSATPSIPGADVGRLRPGDHAYVPFYVGSRDGLFVSDPSAKRGYDQVRSGLDWLNPCK